MTLAGDVSAIVGGAVSITERHPGVVRRIARSAMGGSAAGPELVVDDRHPELRPFVVALPDAPDLLAAVIAEAITTALAIRRRFGRALAGLRRMSYDLSDRRMATGHLAGNAHLNMSTIHLNAMYVTASGVAAEERRLGRPVVVMRALVAHELWHLIELAWEVRDYRTTVAFRRELGHHFGVETIEHAIVSDDRAKQQLLVEVSPYATTGSKEATAEMFEQWWTAGPRSPAVARFGELVDRYFPAPAPPS